MRPWLASPELHSRKTSGRDQVGVVTVEVLDARHLSQIVAAMRACASIVSARRDRGVSPDGAGLSAAAPKTAP